MPGLHFVSLLAEVLEFHEGPAFSGVPYSIAVYLDLVVASETFAVFGVAFPSVEFE